MDKARTLVDSPSSNTPYSQKCKPFACILDPVQNAAKKAFASIGAQYDRIFGENGLAISCVLLALGGAALYVQLSYIVAVPILVGGVLFAYLDNRSSTYKQTNMINEINVKRDIRQKECEKIYNELFEAKLAILIEAKLAILIEAKLAKLFNDS